jgi:hypothetical protein
MGGGLLYDASAFRQDDDSRQQLQLDPDHKIRDGRLLLKGRLKFRWSFRRQRCFDGDRART